MSTTVKIRRYRPGEAPVLLGIYYSAVHLVSSRDYSPQQIEAWAPRKVDPALWEDRVRRINPFVAVLNERIVGYADLRSTDTSTLSCDWS